MAAPYTAVTVNDYNLNAPPDDGSTAPENQITWAKHKTKLGDPVKTAIETTQTNITAAMAKMPGGAGIQSTAISYQVLSADQGKTIRATAGGITITTPSATSVGAPFRFRVKNESSSDITLDGSGSQTIDDVAALTIPARRAVELDTDGTNWFTGGVNFSLTQPNGVITNGILAVSVGSNALTIALKTLAGNDPAVGDPVTILFRDVDLGDGNFVQRHVTSALSIVVPNGATLGTSNSTRFEVWAMLFDEAGSVRIGVINPLSSTGFFHFDDSGVHSATLVSTGSDSAGTLYSNDAVTSVAAVMMGMLRWSSGLATAGAWSGVPDLIYLKTPDHSLPPHGRPFLHVRDEKAAGTSGGTFTQDAWRTRVLNTVLTNEISGASLGSNQITLPAGTYYAEAYGRAFGCGNHVLKLRNTSDSTDTIIGFGGRNPSSALVESIVRVNGRFTISAQKVIELQHYCTATRSTDGFGEAANISVAEVYAEVKIWKER